MLFMHILLSKLDEGHPHPYRASIGHWLMCAVLTLVLWVGLGLALVTLALLFNLAIPNTG